MQISLSMQRRVFLSLLFIAMLVVFSWPSAAHAETIDAEPGASTISFVFSWVTVIQFVIQIGLPMLVALTTKLTTSGRMRGVLLALYTLIAAILNAVVQGLLGTPVDLFGVLVVALFGFLTSVGFYFGLWGAKGPVDPDTGIPAPSISAAVIAGAGVKNTQSELIAANRNPNGF